MIDGKGTQCPRFNKILWKAHTCEEMRGGSLDLLYLSGELDGLFMYGIQRARCDHVVLARDWPLGWDLFLFHCQYEMFSGCAFQCCSDAAYYFSTAVLPKGALLARCGRIHAL